MSGMRAKALFVVGLQLLAMFVVVSNVMVAPVKGAGLPTTINGDWVITDKQDYWGGTCDINGGNVIVRANGVLSLHRVTLRINNDGNVGWISVLQNGKLVIDDSKIMSNSGIRYNMSFDFGSTAIITNSNISDMTNIWVLSSNVKFDGNEIFNGDYGPFFDGRNTPGIAPVFTNNTVHDMDSIPLQVANSAAVITGNTIKNSNSAGDLGAVLIAGLVPTFRNNTLTNNQGAGLVVAGVSKMEVWDSTFNNPGRDVLVEGYDLITRSPTATSVVTYDCTVNSVGTNTWIQAFQISESKATFQPFWNVAVQVKRQSTGKTVNGATVEINAKDGTKLVSGLTTGFDGMVHNIWVPQKKIEHTGAQGASQTETDYQPHVVWASAMIGSNSVRTNVTTPIDHSGMQINVTIDDLPPSLLVASPVNGFMTNETGIDVMGRTDPSAALTIGGTTVQVSQSGDFTKYVGLLEGKNTIPVVAVDASGNLAQVDLIIYRDTKAPVVKIIGPANGTTIGNPDPYVIGTAEPGSLLTINGKIVTVNADKSFNTTIHLSEGQSTITAIDRDKVGNVGVDSVTVTVDSTPPTLIIVEPADNKRTRDANLTIKGITENNALLTVNGQIVPFSGISFQTLVMLHDGENDIIIMTSDSVGNTLTKMLIVFLDTVAPDVTVSYPKDGFVTNLDAIVVTGTTEPGAIVKINDQVADNIAGAFSKEVKLGASANVIKVVVTDTVGNAVVKEIRVTKDTIPPELSVTSPKEGAVINGQTSGKVEVKGKTELGATVYVNGERAGISGQLFQAYVWLAQGNNTIEVTAYDEAGNLETIPVSVTFDSKVDAEILTPSNEFNTSAESLVATGFVEPGATVKINDRTAVVSPQGGFSETVTLVQGRNTLTFTITDKAGNSLIVTRYVNVAGGGKKPSASAMPLNMLFLVLIIVFVVAILAVLMSGRPKKEKPAVYNPSAEPPPPSFMAPGGAPPPPDFSQGGMTPPPAYGYAPPYQPDAYAQQPQAYEGTATAVEEQPIAEGTATEAPPEPTQPEEDIEPKKAPVPEDIDEDMTPKKAPVPEDMPKTSISYKEMASEKDVAKGEGAWARKSAKPKDALDEILDDENADK